MNIPFLTNLQQDTKKWKTEKYQLSDLHTKATLLLLIE